MSTYERNYAEDVKIDRYKLEEECTEHPSIYWYWTEQLMEARAELDKIKTQYDLVVAETELYLRKNPPEGIKVTEATIAALVVTNGDVHKKRDEMDAAKKKVNLLAGAVQSLEHKKSQLDNLRHLCISGYYSRSEGNKTKSGMDQAEDDSRTGLNKKEDNDE